MRAPRAASTATAGPAEEAGALETPLGYFQDQFARNGVAGRSNQTIAAAWMVRGPLGRPALEAALRRLAARHEALRTRIVDGAGGLRQQIAPTGTIDLVGLPPTGGGEEAALRRAADEADTPFDLDAPSLARAGIGRLGEHEQLLTLTLHHVIADGWSARVLDHELRALLAAELRGGEDIPPPAAQFRDVVALEGARDTGAAARYLGGVLAAPEQIRLPRTRPEAAGPVVIRARPLPTLAAATVRALEGQSRRLHASLPIVLFAALGLSLYPYLAPRVRIGVVHTNRLAASFRGVIGPVADVLAIGIELDPRSTFAEHVERVRRTWFEALVHQLPYGALNELAGNGRDWQKRPLTDVGINFFAAPPPLSGTGGDGSGLEITSLGISIARRSLRQRTWLESTLPLSLLVGKLDDDSLGAVLTADGAAYDDTALGALGARLWHLLAIVAETPDVTLADLAARLPDLAAAG